MRLGEMTIFHGPLPSQLSLFDDDLLALKKAISKWASGPIAILPATGSGQVKTRPAIGQLVE
jgi:hypothetical protein